MATREMPLMTGDPIDIILTNPGTDSKELVYVSKLRNWDDRHMMITVPLLKDQQLVCPKLPFNVACRLRNGALLWGFQSSIVHVTSTAFTLLRPDPKFVKIEQRRAYVRASVKIKAKGYLVMANRYFSETEYEIINLSGGGCRLQGPQPFIPNTVMRLLIPTNRGIVEVHGKVVRTNPFPVDEAETLYTTGFTFTKISENDRELLIKFVFEKMREDLKQGKFF